jgi:hypothetical protein
MRGKVGSKKYGERNRKKEFAGVGILKDKWF